MFSGVGVKAGGVAAGSSFLKASTKLTVFFSGKNFWMSMNIPRLSICNPSM